MALEKYMPSRRLKLFAEFTQRAAALLEFAERNSFPATLRTKLEGVLIEASRVEVEMRAQLERGLGNSD